MRVICINEKLFHSDYRVFFSFSECWSNWIAYPDLNSWLKAGKKTATSDRKTFCLLHSGLSLPSFIITSLFCCCPVIIVTQIIIWTTQCSGHYVFCFIAQHHILVYIHIQHIYLYCVVKLNEIDLIYWMYK